MLLFLDHTAGVRFLSTINHVRLLGSLPWLFHLILSLLARAGHGWVVNKSTTRVRIAQTSASKISLNATKVNLGATTRGLFLCPGF